MIPIIRSNNLKTKPDDHSKLGFGNIFTDYMFSMEYDTKNGWHDAKICPYGPISLDPSSMCLHYSQQVFEGLKAYKSAEDRVFLFRPMENIKRLNDSCRRMCIPTFDEEFLFSSLKELISIEKDWIFPVKGCSLYVRPFIIATTPYLGVRPADNYKFFIILSPCGDYYGNGMNPIDVYVEDSYVRAVKGGVGNVKTGGNYSASLYSQSLASRANYNQVLWLDAFQHKYVEEVGTMNVFFVIDGKIVTPPLNGTILPGVTRKSIIEIAKSWNVEVEERRISIEEVFAANNEGRLAEAFGTGTAAAVTPIGSLTYKKKNIIINNKQIGKATKVFYDFITAIQYGESDDKFDWMVQIK